MVVFATGCGYGDEPCEPPACPPGFTRDPVNGDCVATAPATDTKGAPGAHISLAIRPDGVPVVASYDIDLNAIVIGTRSPDGRFVFEKVTADDEASATAPDADLGPPIALALDSHGRPAVSHYDAEARALNYSWFDGAAWRHERVPAVSGDYGRHSVLAFDVDGRAHVAFYDSAAGALGYGVRTDDGWRSEIVPRTLILAAQQRDRNERPGWIQDDERTGRVALDYGRYASMGVSHGTPTVALYEAVGGDLLLATLSVDGWGVQFIDGRDPATGEQQNDVGRHVSLAVDTFGDVSLAYFDTTEGTLRFARSARGVILIETVDDGVSAPDGTPWADCGRHIVGQRASLAIDHGLRPTIAYFDATALSLRFARRRGDGSWERSVLDPRRGAGLWLAHKTHADRSLVAYAEVDPFRPRPIAFELREVAP